MNHRDVGTGLLLASLLLCRFWLPGVAAAAEEGCVSGKCHAALLKGQNVHPIAENCEGCHESIATPHPKKGQNTFKLTQEQPELCYTCHEKFGSKAEVHPPAKEGMCSTCHNPHAADEPKLLTQPLKDLCAICHADHVDFKVVHGPVSAGACTACHAAHESDAKTLLLKQGEELCAGCHLDVPEMVKKKNLHPALQGGCTSCHNPHGAAHPKMLAEAGAQLCFLCHGEIGEKITQAPVVHAAVKGEQGCAACHSPHAGDHEKLLLNPLKETCLSCHSTVITKNMTVLHGPNNDGKCTRCHDPHGSQNAKLLAKAFPTDPYVPYTETEFALCFSCHKRDLLQYPDTSFATNFRDGDKNLHYLHVNNKQKGRSCRLCHDMHGSSQPKLIAESVPFGKWNLPLRFVKTETGGGCSPGCHKTLYYDRQTPGKKPDVAKPASKRD
ncbi:MAG: cytochrome C [Deltaproteobacteria bacterium]|nr:cytochrome C [Deltaproteobacteria bacterium]